ncbi:MAG: hypothetical protein JXB88_11270, partial [Spirochaetales bacterium]|nr:hypothetical protein [Spirochaetales bacterium]
MDKWTSPLLKTIGGSTNAVYRRLLYKIPGILKNSRYKHLIFHYQKETTSFGGGLFPPYYIDYKGYAFQI